MPLLNYTTKQELQQASKKLGVSLDVVKKAQELMSMDYKAHAARMALERERKRMTAAAAEGKRMGRKLHGFRNGMSVT